MTRRKRYTRIKRTSLKPDHQGLRYGVLGDVSPDSFPLRRDIHLQFWLVGLGFLQGLLPHRLLRSYFQTTVNRDRSHSFGLFWEHAQLVPRRHTGIQGASFDSFHKRLSYWVLRNVPVKPIPLLWDVHFLLGRSLSGTFSHLCFCWRTKHSHL